MKLPLPQGERAQSLALLALGLRPAAPQAAVAPRHERQTVGVAGHARVFLQLELLLGLVPAFAGLAELLHLRRRVAIEREHRLGIVFGAEPAVRRARITGNQPLPVERDDLLDE